MAWDGEVFAQPNRLEDSSLTTRQVWNRLSSGRLTWREAFQIHLDPLTATTVRPTESGFRLSRQSAKNL